MLSRLVLQRVSSRAFAPNVAATAALRSALVARHHLARTFLTTAQVSEPVAKDSEGAKSKAKAKAKATTVKKTATKKTTATKKAGITKTTAKKSKAKSKKAETEDPEARLKAPLKSIKLRKDEKPPTGPPTAYSLYIRQLYMTGTKVSNHDEFMARSREAAAQWKLLSEEEKKPFHEKEKELRAEYHSKLADWFTNTDPRIISAYNKQRRASHKRQVHAPLEIRPHKPTPSFIQFTREVTDQIEVPAGLSHKEAVGARSRAIAEKWKALPEEERERYKSQYRDALNQYKLEHPKAQPTV